MEIDRLKAHAKSHKRLLIRCFVLLDILILGIVTNYLLIGRSARYILLQDQLSTQRVAVVLGGGVDPDGPRPLVQERLDAGAKLYKDKKVQKLIVSGDNRVKAYNEPEVMKKYLVQKQGISSKDVIEDFAGRSTYETCERTRKVFDVTAAIFVSESAHLPRVIYTCRSFGIEAYGFASDGQAAGRLQLSQRFREVLARTKASLNIYVVGEKTVLGDRIKI